MFIEILTPNNIAYLIGGSYLTIYLFDFVMSTFNRIGKDIC